MSVRRCRTAVAMAAFLVALGAVAAHGQEAAGEEPTAPFGEDLTVTATRLPVAAETTGRAIAVLTAEELARHPVHSLPELLQLLPGLDVARRGPFGIQADLSARGSSFEDVLVLLDDVPISNPQTGHHNLDLPVPVAAIARVEVLYGPGAALYGGNASGAVVRIVTRRPPAAGVRAGVTLLAGGHSLAGAEGELSAAGQRTGRHSLYATRSESTGWRRGTEFDQTSLWYRGEAGPVELVAGVSDRDFGAWRFYSDRYPDEREETGMRFVRGAWAGHAGRGRLHLRLGWREHRDLFQLDRARPELATNRHRTRVGDGEAAWSGKLGRGGELEAGIGWRQERLSSDSLGDRERERLHAFAAWARDGERGSWRGALFVERVAGEWEVHPSLAVSVPLHRGRLRFAAASAYRVPSFTELYYRDPAIEGNPGLAPERSLTVEGGYELEIGGWLAGGTLFHRDGRDLVDFVRPPGGEVFRALNVREVVARGCELTAARALPHSLELSLGYAHLEASGPAPAGTSRYVFDLLRHHLVVRLAGPGPRGFSWAASLAAGERTGQPSYARLDLRLAREIPSIAGLELFVEGQNLTAARYRERGGLEMPGRWLWAGVGWWPREGESR
ncbi:MAG: Colicin I receptor precursor [Acidobacteria bacterium ADurb.Bin051]|nr:MAG: Colicin I receptor precursor [Acidobacteria bacterium ADurb.Bin051]